jgi:chromosome segregation ATPase
VDFKIQQDEKRLDRLSEEMEKQEKQIEKNEKKLTLQNTALATVAEIDAIGKPGLLGNISVPPEDMKKLKHLAKKGVTADDKVRNANRKRKAAERERDELKNELAEERKRRPSITEHLTWWGKVTAAMKRAPKRLMEVIEDILRKPPEVPEPEQQQTRTKKVETPSL